ncbi:MAG: hypothetical protein KC410_15015 [Anaerolineales bacterium]|uniref:hypothetical protein n=1 Tax=Promineifilum sp. TaxID=2664178 RepID=UPI001DEFBB9C|nr:hypothetical protein [Anaerolineales bacterium]MCO5181040.1 hypothetical protein [Promineifilum sp.]
MMKRFVLIVFFVLFVCAGCLGNGDGTADAPARAVEKYLSAKVTGNADDIRGGLCADMESVLERELRTFESVSNATIENMNCASDDAAAATETIVRCTGEIAALYGTEETTFPLAAYRAVNEDGEWKWCGETQ